MNISKLNMQETMPQKGRKIGAATGALVSSAYLLKNRQDIFSNTIKRSVAMFGTKGKGIIAAGLSAGITTAALTTVGALVGTITGKIVESIQTKAAIKQAQQLIANSVQEIIKSGDVEKHTVEDLEELFGENEKNTGKQGIENPVVQAAFADKEGIITSLDPEGTILQVPEE